MLCMMIALIHDIHDYFITKYIVNLSHLHSRTNFDYNMHIFDYCMFELSLTTRYTSQSNHEASPIETRVWSKILQISTLDQTLQHQGNKLAIIMQFYQVHTMKELAHFSNFSVTKCNITSMSLVLSW